MNKYSLKGLLLFLSLLLFYSCNEEKPVQPTGILQLSDVKVGTATVKLSSTTLNTPFDKPIVATFNTALETSSVANSVQLKEKSTGEIIPLTFSFLNDDKTFSGLPAQSLKPLVAYSLIISDNLRGKNGENFPGFKVEFSTMPAALNITGLLIAGTEALNSNIIDNVVLTGASFEITFSAPVDVTTITDQTIRIASSGVNAPLAFQFAENNTKVIISVSGEALQDLSRYELFVSNAVKGANKEELEQLTRAFYTAEDPTPKFPILSDEALLTMVQQQTFKYFWDFGHPVSGMARERDSSGDIVTTGGTGFGLMGVITGIQRNFITRSDGIERLNKIIDFLTTADRFHGAWPHWMNGVTGKVIPFSTNDNGGDLVETSFLIQGMLAVRQFLNPGDLTEAQLIGKINTLWETVEWDWYTRGGQNVLYWHWSPTVDWAMNHQLRGHNETLITYILAASSPTYSINPVVYHEGYARNGGIKNGKTFYGIVLPLGEDYGGPLFFSHYSFLGLDPRNLSDIYANYWEQNVNHSTINREYVIDNPKNFVGYSGHNWGLTASDNQLGYAAHSPLNDLGVITPTAALSSFPYTPEYSMEAMKFFYYGLGPRIWGEYGFKDAFNITEGWYASSYLAIDQGPIIVMIENHRTGLIWNLFMSNPEVQTGLTALGFTY